MPPFPGPGSRESLNLAWVLIAGFLVMFMQVGFAMLETGFTRAKNAVNTMAMNMVIYPIGLHRFLPDRLWLDAGRGRPVCLAGFRHRSAIVN